MGRCRPWSKADLESERAHTACRDALGLLVRVRAHVRAHGFSGFGKFGAFRVHGL